MNRIELIAEIKRKKSFLCVGLDTDVAKIPEFLKACEDPVFEFNKAIIDATLPYTVAYKPNLAFYEALGISGLNSLSKTISYINNLNEAVFIIADAKRGDIGNTSERYANAFFNNPKKQENYNAVTVAPYMGEDSIKPFMGFDNSWVVILALTSNKGAFDFQMDVVESGERVFEKVLRVSSQWGSIENTMYVVGATKADMLSDVRKIVPHHFLLVPGVGAQGGSLSEVAKYGMTDECGLLVNASRSIIYASNDEYFAQNAALEARKMQMEMCEMLRIYSQI
ncbi:MAG: orotidine-5'-phosphate decarboxylase [Bacteroidales bacterium]|nr:orotidine-5'-phosphate decarboxylase [Bacteroidales bacterium]